MEQETAHSCAQEGWLALPAGPAEGGYSGTLSEERAHLWALVLEARYLPCRIEQGDAGWQLLVPVEHLARALKELSLFEEENRDWPPVAPLAPPLVENSLATASVLILLATFHNLTRLDTPLLGHILPDWAAAGGAHAGKILNGEWWRAVTALTLHADGLHLFSNLALGGIFIVCLCRELGAGLAWSLLLVAGTLGNLANACVHPPEHSSVGASTLVFGAVGILAAQSVLRYLHQRQRPWPLPAAAGLALLALLGTEGERTDLGAHLFGFLFGTGLGLAAEYLVGRNGRPGRVVNALLALVCAITVASAWWLALTE